MAHTPLEPPSLRTLKVGEAATQGFFDRTHAGKTRWFSSRHSSQPAKLQKPPGPLAILSPKSHPAPPPKKRSPNSSGRKPEANPRNPTPPHTLVDAGGVDSCAHLRGASAVGLTTWWSRIRLIIGVVAPEILFAVIYTSPNPKLLVLELKMRLLGWVSFSLRALGWECFPYWSILSPYRPIPKLQTLSTA